VGRRAPLTVAEPGQRDDQQALDDQEHAGRPPEDAGEELVDRRTEIRPGLECGLRERAAAACNPQRNGEQPESVSRHGVESPRCRSRTNAPDSSTGSGGRQRTSDLALSSTRHGRHPPPPASRPWSRVPPRTGTGRRRNEPRVHRRRDPAWAARGGEDRKSTRLNSSHEWISYAVFCLKKKKTGNM